MRYATAIQRRHALVSEYFLKNQHAKEAKGGDKNPLESHQPVMLVTGVAGVDEQPKADDHPQQED
jgi:hypothetical protein